MERKRKYQPRMGGSYYTGNPVVNLFLAILAQAKCDTIKTIPEVIKGKYWEQEKAFILSARRMWQAFQESGFYGKRAIGPLEVAWWVCEYIKGLK